MKIYMVLGFRDFPSKDPKSEADNPYIFYSLKRAIEYADELSKFEECARVVEVVDLYKAENHHNGQM